MIIPQTQDYKGLFDLLDGWVKPLLAREIERNNINDTAANHRWTAWQNTKRLALALSRSGADAQELIAWLEAQAEQRKKEIIILNKNTEPCNQTTTATATSPAPATGKLIGQSSNYSDING